MAEQEDLGGPVQHYKGGITHSWPLPSLESSLQPVRRIPRVRPYKENLGPRSHNSDLHRRKDTKNLVESKTKGKPRTEISTIYDRGG